MLIAPLLRPIQGMAFGIATGSANQFWKSAKLLMASMAVSIVMAWVAAIIIPIHANTTEILARTSPNLLDLLIAIVSSVVAFLALSYEELSEGIAGVAMATALMPPLAVVGIEIAFLEPSLAWGSFFLFFTNLFAIVLVGTLMFFAYGFSPHQRLTQKNTIRQLSVLFGLGLLITIPLVSSLLNISDSVQLQGQAKIIIESSLAETLPEATLSKVDIASHSPKHLELNGTIKLPEGIEFFQDAQETLRSLLNEEIGRDITLNLEVIRTASIVARDKIQSIEERIRSATREQILARISHSTIVKIDVALLTGKEAQEKNLRQRGIKTVISIPQEVTFGKVEQQQLESKIAEQFEGEDLSFFWSILPVQTIARTVQPSDAHLNKLTLSWDEFFADALPKGSYVENFTLSWEGAAGGADFHEVDIQRYTISFDLFIPQISSWRTNTIREKVGAFAEAILDRPADVTFRAFPYDFQAITTDS